MSSLNKVQLIGRLGADPEVKNVASGQTVAQVSMATSERWKDKDGQPQERTEWHRVVVWGKLAEIVGQYLRKGSQAYFEGRLQTRSWEDQQGQKRWTTEIVATDMVMLGAKNQSSSQSQQGASEFGPEPSFDSNEEIPF